MTTAPPPPDLLQRVGEALFGPQWQSQLARELGVADRTVRRWVAGSAAPRDGVWHDLDQLLETRIALQRQARTQLRQHLRHIPPQGT